jgi:hypothetical protein
LIFSFIQFIYKWKFIHFPNTKHAITTCKVFVNGAGKWNPHALRRHILFISPPNLAIYIAISAPRDGAHFVFRPYDQNNTDQCTTFSLVLICSVTGLSTLISIEVHISFFKKPALSFYCFSCNSKGRWLEL